MYSYYCYSCGRRSARKLCTSCSNNRKRILLSDLKFGDKIRYADPDTGRITKGVFVSPSETVDVYNVLLKGEFQVHAVPAELMSYGW